jgi:hypothetical protein
MMNAFEHEGTNPRHLVPIALALVVILALSASLASLVVSSSAAVALNDVQASIQTTQSLPYQYSLAAYNSSGDQVASFSGNYPEASFGLPDGTYLITASADYQSYGCNLCPLAAGVNGSSVAIRYEPPASEYGFVVVKVTGPVQLSITTKNNTDFSLVSIPVHVSFFNGTSGAYVSAYVVGMGYSYSPNVVAYGQTGADGNLTLVMPDAPVQVSAYLSVPVQLPKNVTTIVPVEVGGQKVNVTVYWQPDYVYLSGQALVLPPQTSASITLQVQQNPYPIYYSSPGQGGATTVTTVTSTATGSPAQTASSGQQGRIAPFDPSSAQLSSPGQAVSVQEPYSYTILALVVVAGLGALAIGVALGRKRLAVSGARP